MIKPPPRVYRIKPDSIVHISCYHEETQWLDSPLRGREIEAIYCHPVGECSICGGKT